MGNLLGSPITEKETHRGSTPSGIEYGVSSMQGWRIHMEDAHICLPELYAEYEEEVESKDEFDETTTTPNGGESNSPTSKTTTTTSSPTTTNNKTTTIDAQRQRSIADINKTPTKKLKRTVQIPVKNTSMFAVFDGHGGTIAAEYSAKHLPRVLSRRPKFVEYAKLMAAIDENNEKKKTTTTAETTTTTTTTTTTSSSSTTTDGTKETPTTTTTSENEKDNDTTTPTTTENNTSKEHTTPPPPATDDTTSSTSTITPLNLLEDALRESFLELDKELLDYIMNGPSPSNNLSSHHPIPNTNPAETAEERDNRERDESGTTVCVVILTQHHIICANAGDSRSVYGKVGGVVVPLSYDHKPDDEAEEQRIVSAGGYVSGGRVDGDLAVSRGFGDFRFKACAQLDPEDQRVSPIPDIIVHNRNDEKDEFIVVACDGIWDVATNQECVQMVSEIFSEGETDTGTACEEVLDLCLRRGSKDNMTSLIVKLPALKIGEGGGVAARREKLADSDERKNEMELD